MTVSHRRAVERALQPGRFFLRDANALKVVHRPHERIAWEIYGGHLLDAWQTRQRGEFEAWDVVASVGVGKGANQPVRLLSVKYSPRDKKLYVVRYLWVYGWQPFERSPGVIESRPVQKEMPELVGTVDLGQYQGHDAKVSAQLSTLLYLAVVGTSRLAITSLESPLPAFTLGELMYLPREAGFDDPVTEPRNLIRLATGSGATLPQKAKLLEATLRAAAAGEIPEVAECLMGSASDSAPDRTSVPALLRTLLNDVALSPYTGFAAKFIDLLDELSRPEALGAAAVVDVLSYLLRHLARHLTAFDLSTFHNRGANYPDALLLDAALKMYLGLIERWPRHFEAVSSDNGDAARQKRVRRRALRQAVLLRETYEGLPVPDTPTSPGENQRVLPQPYAPVPEEQIAQPRRRHKRLYANEPMASIMTATAARLLKQSIDDLQYRAELEELGMALFLDRPLGIFKQPGEVDRTPLLSYEAFSGQIAAARLRRLYCRRWIDHEARVRQLENEITAAPISGYPAGRLSAPQRQGVVCLEDARLVAADFVFRKTTRRSLNELLLLCDWSALAQVAPKAVGWLHSGDPVLLIRTATADEAVTGKAFLTAYDVRMQPRLEIVLPTTGSLPRYRESWGVEVFEGGLWVAGIGNTAETRPTTLETQRDHGAANQARRAAATLIPFSLHGSDKRAR